MVDQIPFKGFWSLICDSETESTTCSARIDTVLDIISKLQEKMPEMFPKPPKVSRYPNNLDYLRVFTSDNSVEEIKKSAEAIRSVVDFPFIIYYYKRDVTDPEDKKLQYNHTPDGELYKFMYNSLEGEGSLWKIISKKTEQTATDLLPSKVTNMDYIHLPVDEENFRARANEKGGKWIVNCSDFETLDTLWKNLTRLYYSGVLVGLKSCTAKFSIEEKCPDYHAKVIMCYTADASCKTCAKRTAQSIYICTGYNRVMYYKTNEASRNGQYRHEGFTKIAKYMFTSGGEMYEKDYINRWKKINFNEESINE